MSNILRVSGQLQIQKEKIQRSLDVVLVLYFLFSTKTILPKILKGHKCILLSIVLVSLSFIANALNLADKSVAS